MIDDYDNRQTGEGAAEHALVDDSGVLLRAGERLGTLNERAGGRVGGLLVIPQLARLARLTRTLGVPIARAVIAADGERDVEIWVRTKASADGVELALAGWTPRPPRPSWLVAQPDPVPQPALLDWTWATDAQLDLTALTLAPEDTTDMRAADVLGLPLTRLVRLIDDEAGDMPVLRALAARASFTGQRAVRRDLPRSEFALAGQPRFDDHGAFAGFSGQAAVVTTIAAEVAPPGSGTDLTARVAEVMRAPLDRIIARAETIGAQVDGPLRRDYADYAGDIANAGRHLLALVSDLGDLQEVERPDFKVVGERIDLADVARRAGGLLGVRAANKNVRIDRPESGESLLAIADFRRALQILVNLVGNAVRYSPPGGMVWLRGERDGDSAVIVVADQGKGIAIDDQARIFEKFERVDTSDPEGSGLGLYISRRLARAMGGDVTVDSAPGQGARFMLTLPAG